MNTNNTKLIDVGESVPVDWSPRVYFYNTELQSWEKGEIEEVSELSEEEIKAIEEKIKQAELALLNSQAEINEDDNTIN